MPATGHSPQPTAMSHGMHASYSVRVHDVRRSYTAMKPCNNGQSDTELTRTAWMDMDLYLHTAPFLSSENSNRLNTCMPCYHAEITHADDRCMLISKTPIPWCFRSPVEQRGSTVASARGFKQLDGVRWGSGVDAARDMMTDERIATTSSSSGQQPSFAASTGRVEGS